VIGDAAKIGEGIGPIGPVVGAGTDDSRINIPIGCQQRNRRRNQTEDE